MGALYRGSAEGGIVALISGAWWLLLSYSTSSGSRFIGDGSPLQKRMVEANQGPVFPGSVGPWLIPSLISQLCDWNLLSYLDLSRPHPLPYLEGTSGMLGSHVTPNTVSNLICTCSEYNIKCPSCLDVMLFVNQLCLVRHSAISRRPGVPI